MVGQELTNYPWFEMNKGVLLSIVLLSLQFGCGQNGEKALSMGEYRQYDTIIQSISQIVNLE